MSDRELLEKAAKAAGLVVHAGHQASRDACGGGDVGLWISNVTTCWNPLTDDGDALRLAVKLGLVVSVDYKLGLVFCTSIDRETYQAGEGLGDPYAATRRAIVRAAAAMGDSGEG